ncbi:MAG: response regulator, partial [Candidatus Auribacterota bacterium]|nr:response regulator [Candidatus Auribacterota bacterium]
MTAQGNILAIDDDRLSLKLIESYLKDSPFKVTTINDPKEALSLFGDNNYDLVLSDIRMPGLDGFQVLRQVRLHHPGLPVI